MCPHATVKQSILHLADSVLEKHVYGKVRKRQLPPLKIILKAEQEIFLWMRFMDKGYALLDSKLCLRFTQNCLHNSLLLP